MTLFLFLLLSLYPPPVQDLIASKLSRLLSREGQQIELEGLHCHWPFQLRLGSLTVSDETHKWLIAKDLRVNWKYQSGTFTFTTARIEEINIAERPAFAKSSSDKTANTPSPLKWGIELPHIEINRLQIGEWAGGKKIDAKLSGAFSFPANQQMISANAQLAIDNSTLSLQSTYHLGDSKLSADLNLSLSPGAILSARIGHQENQLTVSVNADTPDARQTLKEIEQWIAEHTTTATSLHKILTPKDAEPFPLQASLQIESEAGVFSGSSHLKFEGGELHSPFTFETKSQSLHLQAETDIDDLSKLGSFIGQPLSGKMQSDLSLVFQQGLQDLSASLSGQQLVYRKMPLGSIDANIEPDLHGWQGAIELQRGDEGSRQSAELQLQYLPDANGGTLTAHKLSLQTPTLHFLNHEPLVLIRKGNQFEIPLRRVNLNGHPFTLSASGDPHMIDVEIDIPKIDSAKLPSLEQLSLHGFLEANFSVKGTWARPEAKAKIEFADLQLMLGEYDADIRMNGIFNGTWNQQGLSIDAQVIDNHQTQIQLTASSPEPWSLKPFTIPDQHADFAANATGSIDLALLNRLNRIPNHRLYGQLTGKVDYTQSKGTPRLNGSLDLNKGAVENYQLGTRLQDLTFQVQMHDREIELNHGSAKTPGKGTLSAKGKWELGPFPGDGELVVTLSKARLLHLDPILAALSGKVSLSGTSGQTLKLGGNLKLEETTFYMDRLPKSLPKPLPYRSKSNRSEPAGKHEPPKTTKAPAKKSRITGEIHLDIPGQLNVEGKNIHSNWEGEFKISLQEGDTYLIGELSPRRGTITFFGRAFRFSTGTVHFNETVNSTPILDVEAEYHRDDMDATLRITGRADNPRFQLQSSPPYPEDEILSRILFGKDMSTITGLQALEVGLALKSMMDSDGNSLDLMGKARDILHVDQLELRESGDVDGSAELVAGRQINNRLYLEFNQSLKESGSSIILEYEIKRNLSISTETGTHTLPGIGVNWKKDY
ncbi:translocation/assembly module TamB domain-containing protein [Kiritimatiellaeota bacterium B1221]|nr:translocation/assembly module TamB domain-containing protein [Kiritimatiellaeota bacterium B1221]